MKCIYCEEKESLETGKLCRECESRTVMEFLALLKSASREEKMEAFGLLDEEIERRKNLN